MSSSTSSNANAQPSPLFGGVRNLSHLPSDPYVFNLMSPLVIAYLWNRPIDPSSSSTSSSPLYIGTDSKTILNYVPYVTPTSTSLVWASNDFRNLFFTNSGSFSCNSSQRAQSSIHLNNQTFSNSDTTTNSFNLATALLAQHSRVFSVDLNRIDPRTIMLTNKQSKRYENLLAFKGFQQSFTWDEIISYLIDDQTILRSPTSTSTTSLPAAAAIVRLDIQFDVFSDVLNVNHIVCLPFLVALAGYTNNANADNQGMNSYVNFVQVLQNPAIS